MTVKIGIAVLAWIAILIVFVAALWWRVRNVPTCPGCFRPVFRCSCAEDRADWIDQLQAEVDQRKADRLAK